MSCLLSAWRRLFASHLVFLPTLFPKQSGDIFHVCELRERGSILITISASVILSSESLWFSDLSFLLPTATMSFILRQPEGVKNLKHEGIIKDDIYNKLYIYRLWYYVLDTDFTFVLFTINGANHKFEIGMYEYQ